MPKTRSGLGGESGNHPLVHDIEQWPDWNDDRIAEKVANESDNEDDIGTSKSAISWFETYMNMDRNDAWDAAEIFLEYSRRGDGPLHENTNVKGNDLLDQIIHNQKAPVYVGDQYRGVFINSFGLSKYAGANVTPDQYVRDIIKSGVWKEPGATSFSTDQHTARSFGGWNRDDGVTVILHYSSGRSGFPMRHLSAFPGENEVLHSRRQMSKGMKIKRYTTETKPYGGTAYHIYVDD